MSRFGLPAVSVLRILSPPAGSVNFRTARPHNHMDHFPKINPSIKIDTSLVLFLWRSLLNIVSITALMGRFPYWKCYNSERKGILALETRKHLEVTLHNKSPREIYWEKQEAAKNWAGSRLYIGFCGVGVLCWDSVVWS